MQHGLADSSGDDLLWGVPTPNVVDSGNDLAQDTPIVAGMVPGDVAGVYPEDRFECQGVATGVGYEQLPNGVADVAKAAAGHGASGP